MHIHLNIGKNFDYWRSLGDVTFFEKFFFEKKPELYRI